MRKEGYVLFSGFILKIIGHVLEMRSLLPTRSDEISLQITTASYFKEIGLIVIIVSIILLIILPDFSNKSITSDK